MRLFRVLTRGLNLGPKEDIVLASDNAPRTDAEVAEDAAIIGNTDPNVRLELNNAMTGLVDIDARSGGSGPTKVFYSVGTDWLGRVTAHWIAAKDKGLLSILAWSSASTYFLAFNQYSTFGGLIYRSLQNGNINHQPDVSPLWWVEDPDAQAHETALQAVTALDSTPPTWSSTDSYGVPAKVYYQGGKWFSNADSTGIPPPNYWIEQLSVIGTPPDWDGVTSYVRGGFVTTQPDGRWFFCSTDNINKDPRDFSVAPWDPDTITVQEALFKVATDVTIEA